MTSHAGRLFCVAAAVAVGGLLCAALLAPGCAARKAPQTFEGISETPATSAEPEVAISAPEPRQGPPLPPARVTPIPPQPREKTPDAAARKPARGSPQAAPAAEYPVRFETTVYEVRVPADRLKALDAAALTARAATPEYLEKALAELGPTRALYRIDQIVNLYGASIRVGKREPVVTGSRVTDSGAVIRTVQYEDVGLILDITAAPAGDAGGKGINVALKGELALIGEGGAEIAENVKASVTYNVTFSGMVPLALGRPFVTLSADVSAAGADGKAVAFVWRGRFSEARP
ncbi:MAG: hypothetical protein IMZ66_01670 [Planctomycetes bacterium]|nr:hypothetical protein [Planctomycetota bacterium]